MYSSNPGKSGSNDWTMRMITTPGSIKGGQTIKQGVRITYLSRETKQVRYP